MIYKNEEFELIDEIIDIGYMAEEFEAENLAGETIQMKKASPNRMIQIFLSFPNFEDFKEEITLFDDFMDEAKVEIFTYIIFDRKLDIPYDFKKLIPIFDINDEFGEMYGTKIVSGNFKDKLTKSLFLIGKDGAVYHIDMPNNLEEPLNLERVRVEVNKVYQSYTGVGCHG